MSPLQQIAMGLVVVLGTARVESGHDLLPDPLGWLLVVAGSVRLTRADAAYAPTRWLAALAGLVSVPLWLPAVQDRLDASGAWAASLPQVAFCLVLARLVGLAATLQQPPEDALARRCGWLVWGFALAGVLPVLALGGGQDWLVVPSQAVSLVAGLGLVWVLFSEHRRPWLGGPGPAPARPATHEGRPPS